MGWSSPLIALCYTVHKNGTIFTVSFYCYYSCRNSHVGCHLLLFEKHDTTLRRLLPDNFYVRNLYRTLRNSAASPRRQHPPRRRFPADASDAHPRRSSRGNASFWEADSFVPPAAPPVRRTPEPQLPRSKTHLMIIGLTQGGCGREVGKLAKRDLWWHAIPVEGIGSG